MTSAARRLPDEAKLEAFMARMMADVGALTNAILVHVGDQLGLYTALLETGPMTPAALAKRTGTAERLIREWLSAQAAQGYVSYDRASERFSLSPEQAMVFAEPDSPVYMAGFYDAARGLFDDTPKIVNAFRTNGALAWDQHNGCLFCGTQRLFRPAYKHNLVNAWLPALDGAVAKLERGARVADVGCGYGASTILMARAFPNSTFHGYDYHADSIAAARRDAQAEGVSDRTTFEIAKAKEFPGKNYDLVCFFDCLHDMGDPVGRGKACPGNACARWHLDDC